MCPALSARCSTMVEASLTDWITAAAAVIAAIGTTAAAAAAWRSAVASRETSQLAADALVEQTERDAAIAADAALRALEVDVHSTDWSRNWGRSTIVGRMRRRFQRCDSETSRPAAECSS